MKKAILSVSVVLFMVLTLSAHPIPAYADLTDGLVSYWNFDEGSGATAYDSVGDNHGTIHGSEWTAGAEGGALSFDGEDDYVEMVSPGPIGNSPRTVCAWARMASTLKQEKYFYAKYILSYGGAYYGFGSEFRAGLSGQGVCEGVTIDICNSAATYSESVDDGCWHHYAFVVPDKDLASLGDVKIYKDGDLVSLYDHICSVDSLTRVLDTEATFPIHVGRYHDPSDVGRHFKGDIDEVMVYDRALSIEEIQQIAVTCLDHDVDGFVSDDPSCGGDDCDDWDSSVYPGAEEICDGKDSDCDGTIPSDEEDGDSDGWMLCEGECDDTNPLVNPEIIESTGADNCDDGLDNDCDGLVDMDLECMPIQVPDDQPTIQVAIEAAWEGALILVAPGIYRENINFYGKDITVKSIEGPVKSIIDGDRSGSAVTFANGETEEAVLDGFTIKNGSGTFITLPYLGAGFYSGGGIFCENSTPTITNCMITNNYAYLGGGFYLRDSSPSLTNCMIVRNWAVGFIHGGGGLYLEGSSPTITHCTISGNFARQYGGGMFCWNSSPAITNSILWGDYSIFDPEIHVRSGSPVVTYSDVEGGWSGEGNIAENPSFAGGVTFHLMLGSPCIDSATDAGVYTDMDGQRRPWGAGFDMGADEFSTEPCSVIASSGNQFVALYMIPVLALIFLRRRFMRR